MTTFALIKNFIDGIFHEDADQEPNLAEQMTDFIDTLDVDGRMQFHAELSELAASEPEVLAVALDDMEFVWDLNGEEALFFAELAQVVSEH